MIDRLMIGLLANGHVLLEGVPGLAKTLAIKTLSDTIGGHFNRVQFTPDLLPADIVGTMIYNQKQEDFSVKKGPIFANFILADEINRAPAKVQSALLEAMQERQVTLGNTTYPLPKPFLVLATQNPVEQEGTYPLPEAQVDRFMLKVYLDYPTKEEEKLIVRHNISSEGFPKPQTVVSVEEILAAKELVKEVYLDEKIEQYIVDLVYATRKPADYGMSDLAPLISFGASPRASINMALAAKAYAFINRRGFVIPEDVRAVCPDVLRHRVGLTYEAEAEDITQSDIVNKIMDFVEVP
jgi:MoxR-like ATPase